MCHFKDKNISEKSFNGFDDAISLFQKDRGWRY